MCFLHIVIINCIRFKASGVLRVQLHVVQVLRGSWVKGLHHSHNSCLCCCGCCRCRLHHAALRSNQGPSDQTGEDSASLLCSALSVKTEIMNQTPSSQPKNPDPARSPELELHYVILPSSVPFSFPYVLAKDLRLASGNPSRGAVMDGIGKGLGHFVVDPSTT